MPKKEIVDHVEWETDDSPEEQENSRPSASSGRKPEKKGKKKRRRKRRNAGLTVLIILLVLLLLIVLLFGACIYLLKTGKLNVLLGKTIQYNGDEEIRHVAENLRAFQKNGGKENGQGRVLGAVDVNRSLEGRSAFDDQFVHAESLAESLGWFPGLSLHAAG